MRAVVNAQGNAAGPATSISSAAALWICVCETIIRHYGLLLAQSQPYLTTPLLLRCAAALPTTHHTIHKPQPAHHQHHHITHPSSLTHTISTIKGPDRLRCCSHTSHHRCHTSVELLLLPAARRSDRCTINHDRHTQTKHKHDGNPPTQHTAHCPHTNHCGHTREALQHLAGNLAKHVQTTLLLSTTPEQAL